MSRMQGGMPPGLGALMQGGGGMGGMGGNAIGMGGLNSIQPAPPMGGPPGQNLLDILGDEPIDFGALNGIDPQYFGIQAGPGNPDPFASMPYTGGNDQLIDQLEGMGLGPQAGMMPSLRDMRGAQPMQRAMLAGGMTGGMSGMGGPG